MKNEYNIPMLPYILTHHVKYHNAAQKKSCPFPLDNSLLSLTFVYNISHFELFALVHYQ